MESDARSVAPATRLAISTLLLMILVTTLFGSFSLMMPVHHWTVWRVPALIGAGGLVALMIAWPSRSGSRPWIMDGLVAVLGLTSAVTGIGIVILIAFGLALHVSENQESTQGLVFRSTDPGLLRHLLLWASIPAVPGAIGLWIARKRTQTQGRTSLAAMAARYALLGLSLAGLVGLVAAFAAAYRWAMWP